MSHLTVQGGPNWSSSVMWSGDRAILQAVRDFGWWQLCVICKAASKLDAGGLHYQDDSGKEYRSGFIGQIWKEDTCITWH